MISASIEARPVPGAAWQHIARVIWHPWKSAARYSWWSRALSVSENPVFYDTAFYGTTIFAPGAPLGFGEIRGSLRESEADDPRTNVSHRFHGGWALPLGSRRQAGSGSFEGSWLEGQQSLQQISQQSAIITAMGILLRRFLKVAVQTPPRQTVRGGHTHARHPRLLCCDDDDRQDAVSWSLQLWLAHSTLTFPSTGTAQEATQPVRAGS